MLRGKPYSRNTPQPVLTMGSLCHFRHYFSRDCTISLNLSFRHNVLNLCPIIFLGLTPHIYPLLQNLFQCTHTIFSFNVYHVIMSLRCKGLQSPTCKVHLQKT